MKAQEIMTRDVVCVRPTQPVSEVAALMSEKHISGVPVVEDNGHVIGVISESDLLHRPELGTERKRKSWLRIFADPDDLAREYAKAHGMRAHDVMSRHVVSVKADADMQQVADTLENHNIKRVPVISDGKLVGIISRGDMIKALSQLDVTRTAKALDDGTIHKALLDKLREASWLDTSYINLIVKDGVAEAWGFVNSADQRVALRVLVEGAEGVTSFDDHLKVGVPNMPGV